MTANQQVIDHDPQETQEWLGALRAVYQQYGTERVRFLMTQLQEEARHAGADVACSLTTPYVNTIPPTQEERIQGDAELEWRIRAFTRWNAMATVVKANRITTELGGHIASFASSATLYDIGYNHFWHSPSENHGGDLVFFQGHTAPGMYARAFMEGRLSEEDLLKFRQEVDGNGLSSYPHPWLMPEFWQFPTVSMGLGPIMAIYQARFMKYLHNRELIQAEATEQNGVGRKVWAFLGDGETDEPETLGAISLAGREKLDNLVFVVNCNLQRLDGPVRGNGKIIQELEGVFRGAGWNVIKVIWGSGWDALLAKDVHGLLRKRMEEAVDGEYQAFKSKGGAYTREFFFGKYPELKEMVAQMTDDDIWRLERGGHDPHKIYAAFSAAVKHTGQPTVILAKTVKGYGMGEAGEGQNITHQQKKMGEEALKAFRNRFNIPISDDHINEVPFYRPADNSPETQYIKQRRAALGGNFPVRRPRSAALEIPELKAFEAQLKDSGDREFSTTMAFVRILNQLTRDKKIGKFVVPIVPDEARTFGMEGMFRQLGIYAPTGQLYSPEDADQLMYYREDKSGQVLQEGINEAGAFCSWIAAGTSYSNHDLPMIPFYIFYSMFGFQRIGDLAWAAGDIQARGFLVGGTAGRTTLAGEGLQHQDGHSHLLAGTVPNCVSYDPTFAYELAVIVQDGLRRMYQEQENIYYYITVMNENYLHPAMPDTELKIAGQAIDTPTGIIKGMYRFSVPTIPAKTKKPALVQLLGCGTILREVIAAAELLQQDFNVFAEVWSVTSFNELAREGQQVERWNLLHPDQEAKQSYVTQCLSQNTAPVVAATDYIRQFANQIRAYIPKRYVVLGTDGFGRSDTRKKLRHFFEVDRYYVALAALKALVDEGTLDKKVINEAISKYSIPVDKPYPASV